MVQFTAGQALAAKRAIQRHSFHLEKTAEAFSPWEWKHKFFDVHSCLFGLLQGLVEDRQEVMLAFGYVTIIAFHWQELEHEAESKAWQHDDFGYQDELVVHPGFTEYGRFNRIEGNGRLTTTQMRRAIWFLDDLIPIVKDLDCGPCLETAHKHLKRVLDMLWNFGRR